MPSGSAMNVQHVISPAGGIDRVTSLSSRMGCPQYHIPPLIPAALYRISSCSLRQSFRSRRGVII